MSKSSSAKPPTLERSHGDEDDDDGDSESNCPKERMGVSARKLAGEWEASPKSAYVYSRGIRSSRRVNRHQPPHPPWKEVLNETTIATTMTVTQRPESNGPKERTGEVSKISC